MTSTVDKKCSTKDVVDDLREQCIEKGLGTLKGLCVLFRTMDKDYSKSVTPKELKSGLKKYDLKVDKSDIEALFRYFDKDGSGHIDFNEFLKALQPPLPACRSRVVLEAFDKLDANKNGILDIEDLKHTYIHNAKRHPKYLSGEWTVEQVLRFFLDAFDSEEEKDGHVTRTEFLQYYAAVSTTVDDDSYFDLMMRSVWGLT